MSINDPRNPSLRSRDLPWNDQPTTPATEAVYIVHVHVDPAIAGIVRQDEIKHEFERTAAKAWGTGVTVFGAEAASPAALDAGRLILAAYRTPEKRGESRKEWLTRVAAEYAK